MMRGRHPLGLSAARRCADRIRLARHHGLCAAQDAPGRRDRAGPLGMFGLRRSRACPDRGGCRCCGGRHRGRGRPLEAVRARSARDGPAARWDASPRSSSTGACRRATGGTRSDRRRTRRRCGHEQGHHRRFAQAARGCAFRHRPRRLSRRSALRRPRACRRPALAARPCLDPRHRRRRRPAGARRAGRPDRGRRGGRRARPASPLRRGQCPDRRALRLRAPAAARRRARCASPASRWR